MIKSFALGNCKTLEVSATFLNANAGRCGLHLFLVARERENQPSYIDQAFGNGGKDNGNLHTQKLQFVGIESLASSS